MPVKFADPDVIWFRDQGSPVLEMLFDVAEDGSSFLFHDLRCTGFYKFKKG